MRINELAKEHTTELDALIDGAMMLDSQGYGLNSNKEMSALFYYPISIGNPFQSLYYSKFMDNGVVPIGTNNLENVASIRWPGKLSLHLHWLGNIIGDTENKTVANQRIDDFLLQIDTMKMNGFNIIWTVHNILPHDAILQDCQIRLRVELVKRCDIIHTMCNDTVELSEAFFTIPKNKIVNVPHPTYENFYPNQYSEIEARVQLGINNDEFVFLFFGSIQAYKGLHDLVRAFKQLESNTEKKLKLIIAGKVYNQSNFKTIKNEIDSSENIILMQNRIPNEDVQHYFKAANVCVCPYRITLNSGVAHLSHTFGTPVIGPNVGGFKELLSNGGGLTFDQLDFDGLVSAMNDSLNMDFTKERKEILKINSKYNPAEISSKFAQIVSRGDSNE